MKEKVGDVKIFYNHRRQNANYDNIIMGLDNHKYLLLKLEKGTFYFEHLFTSRNLLKP